jgi:membrane protease YdiL (CAAX protease family)
VSDANRRRVGAAVALAAGVVVPAALRSAPSVPTALAHAALLAGAIATAPGDPPDARRHARQWLRDAATVAVASACLALLWAARHPHALPAEASVVSLAPLLFGALAEEVVYRGWLPAAVAAATASRTAPATLSTIAFAFAHPGASDGTAFLGHVAAGSLLYALRGGDGSLLAPMLAHATYNAAVRLAGTR